MSGRIVVGLDGSPNSTAAARWAFEEAALRDAQVDVVTVCGLLGPSLMPDRSTLVTDRSVEEAATRMQQEQLAGVPPQVSVVTRVEHGDPGEQLVHAARDAELLVMGARGHTGVSGLLLGSVGLRCLQRAPCPVTIVPAYVADADPGAPVVAGVDGSPSSASALRQAATEASLRGVRLVVLHAVQWPRAGASLVRPSDRELVEWGGSLVAKVLEPVRSGFPDLEVEERVVTGHPAHVLDHAARTAGLLVIGSRGHGRLTGALVGSVSLHVLVHAHRPTMAVVA